AESKRCFPSSAQCESQSLRPGEVSTHLQCKKVRGDKESVHPDLHLVSLFNPSCLTDRL
ncbi:hypothetical protein STEG23_000347, partial [Scotinomys teguina]